jgi:hypothetical protein
MTIIVWFRRDLRTRDLPGVGEVKQPAGSIPDRHTGEVGLSWKAEVFRGSMRTLLSRPTARRHPHKNADAQCCRDGKKRALSCFPRNLTKGFGSVC